MSIIGLMTQCALELASLSQLLSKFRTYKEQVNNKMSPTITPRDKKYFVYGFQRLFCKSDMQDSELKMLDYLENHGLSLVTDNATK